MSATTPADVLRERLRAFLAFLRPRLLNTGADLEKLANLRRLSDVRVRQFVVGKPKVSAAELCAHLADARTGRFDALAATAGLLRPAHFALPLPPLGEETGYLVECCLALQVVGPQAAEAFLRDHVKSAGALAETAAPRTAGPAPLPPAVADLLGGVRELWGAPPHVIQALQLMATPDAAPDAVAAALQRDGALADRLLRLAGASPSSGGDAPSSLKTAAVALGYPLLRRLTTAAALLGTVLDAPGWSHALRTAATAALLARATKTGSPDDHFTAGLLHDVGRAATARHRPGSSPAVPFGEIGACILERWRFPASHVEAARHEGISAEAVEDVQLPREALVVAAACAAVQGRGAAWAPLLRMTEPRLKEVAAQAAALADPAAAALGGGA